MADHVLGLKGMETTLLDVVPGLVMFLFLPLFPRLSRIFGMRNLIIIASVPLGVFYMLLFFVNAFGPADRFWIEEYARRGWVVIAGHLTVDQTFEQFGSELSGYVRAAEDEPWSIHAAAVTAIFANGIAAPDAVADRLAGKGWNELASTCGRWSDAVSAYRTMVSEYRDRLAYPGMTLLRPGENLWDFIMQQQIMPLFSRPKYDTWEGVAEIMDDYPAKKILYGYVSDDTVEEEIAVERASSSGKYLVPTSQVCNLSYHSAVRGRMPVKPVRRKKKKIPKLDSRQVNIALAITDGDNLQVPIMQYPTSTYWNTTERGAMPLGWSMGVSLAALAPGIWEYYRPSVRPNDEIVSIMGIAYVHASSLPDPEEYFHATFASMKDMGLHTLWSLDSSLTITDEPLWDVVENAPSRDALKGVVVGYGPSIDKAFRRDTGTPVMITQNGYSEDARRIRERIETIMATDPSERSPVNFLMATNWDASAAELYRQLKPLEKRGIRFLTPSEALALMPDIPGMARSSVDSDAPPGTCLPVGALKKTGSPILSAPTLAEINKPVPLPVHVAVEGPAEIPSAGTDQYRAVVEIDTDAVAGDFLHNRVLPVVEGYGLSEEFADSAWMKLEATDINIVLPLSHADEKGALTVDAAGTEAKAFFLANSLQIAVGAFTADSRATGRVIRVSVKFDPTGTVYKHGEVVVTGPARVTFDFALTVGIGKEKGPLVGGIRGKMAGRGAETTC